MHIRLGAALTLLLFTACSSGESAGEAVVDPVSAATIVVTQQHIDQARRQMQVVRSAAQMYRMDNPTGCPTIDVLRAEGFVDAKAERDPWGHPLAISCEGREISVISPGPDGQFGTSDDIR